MDELVQRLNQLRLERQEENQRHQRALETSNARERELLAAIQRESRQTAARKDTRTSDEQFEKNVRNNRRNHIKVGDKVRITNRYVPTDYGAIGTVIHVSKTMVDIRNETTGKRNTRAWWNLERIDDNDGAQ